MAPGRWGRVAGSWLAWWLGASALLLMAAGLGLLALSRHARFPPSMDSWDEQALVILEFVGAPILGGLIAARRPANLYGWLWCVIGVGVGLDAFARGYATFGLLGRPPGGLPGVMVAAWATNCTWILGLGLFPLVLLLFPDGRLPTRRWRPCSSRSAAASRRSWTAASTDAATMPRPPSRPSPPAYASSST